MEYSKFTKYRKYKSSINASNSVAILTRFLEHFIFTFSSFITDNPTLEFWIFQNSENRICVLAQKGKCNFITFHLNIEVFFQANSDWKLRPNDTKLTKIKNIYLKINQNKKNIFKNDFSEKWSFWELNNFMGFMMIKN